MDRRNLIKNLAIGAAALSGTQLLSAAESKFLCTKPAAKNDRLDRFPNVLVTDQFGRKARFYDDLVKGKIVCLNFFYTNCEGRCPVYTMNLLKVQKLLGDRVGKDIFMYSLSLDPVRDNPAALRTYSEEHGTGPGWYFLTGTAADMELLRVRLRFTDPDPKLDKDRSSHIGLVLFGNDKLDRWGACPAVTKPSELVKYMSWLEPPIHPAGKKSPAVIQLSRVL